MSHPDLIVSHFKSAHESTKGLSDQKYFFSYQS